MWIQSSFFNLILFILAFYKCICKDHGDIFPTRNCCGRVRFPTVSFRCCTTTPAALPVWDRKMVLSAVGCTVADVFWAVLASGFLAALCAHKVSQKKLPRGFEESRLHTVLQDLVRYGKTKHELKRDDWLRLFDVPKRSLLVAVNRV